MIRIQQSNLLLVKIVFLFLASGLYDRAYSGPEWITCIASQDPYDAAPALFSICPGAHISMDYSLLSGNARPGIDASGHLFGGLHLGALTSLHWKGFLRTAAQTHPYHRSEIIKDTDHLSLNIGKPALHKLGLSVGKQAPAFGVHTRLPSAFLYPYQPSWTYLRPSPGFRLGFDNLTSFSAELSANQNQSSSGPEKTPHSFGARLINDIAAWSGTRLVLSLFANKPGERRIGISAINIAPDGTLSLIEWVRMRTNPDGTSEPFRQLLRFYINGGIRRHRQTYFMYEDIRLTHRLGTLGSRYWFNTHTFFNISLAFRKDETIGRNHRWIFAIGGGSNV